MSLDPRFERVVLAELAIRERRARPGDRLHRARVLAERLHRGRHDLLAHLRRVADAVPSRFRAVAWLHHAPQARMRPGELAAAGLTADEQRAIELLAELAPPCSGHAFLDRARALSGVPGRAGQLARVVERAAIEDRLDGAPPRGETLSTLLLLPDPRLGASWTAR
jgi:hypothetical protein